MVKERRKRERENEREKGQEKEKYEKIIEIKITKKKAKLCSEINRKEKKRQGGKNKVIVPVKTK